MESSAAIVTVGSELTLGLRLDTNTAEIARALAPRGFRVAETVSVADDRSRLAETLRRLTAAYELVVVTGGLGPTHDDITREAASEALSVPLKRDARLERLLAPAVDRHRDPAAGAQVLTQADVLEDAEVIDPTTGTAPGLLVRTGRGTLALLPGPPFEMRSMLAPLLERYGLQAAEPRELGVAQTSESDTQVIVERALGVRAGIGFTILAAPGDVRVILTDDGAGEAALAAAADDAADALGDRCYSREGLTLPEALVNAAAARGLTIGAAESCTGGKVSTAVTDVAGSSQVLLGGLVTYENEAKTELLGVPAELIDTHGAVSEPVARSMAEGAWRRLGCDFAVSVTGIAGPSGGTPEKPVGTVWFGIACAGGTDAYLRTFPGGSRAAIRDRATATALDLLRRAVLGLPTG